MAMTATYTTVDGQILHENRSGVETFLVPDPLGSVIQTRTPSGGTTSSITYWPYGEVRTSSNPNPTPWGYVGSYGYHSEGDRLYVRMRHLLPSVTRWMTSSSLWPEEQPYSYVDDGPTFWIDPTGLQKELPKQKAKSVLGFHYAYGNYCGGDRNPMDDCKRLNWPLPKPWDGLDACCVPHDMAYNKNKCLPFIDQRSECKNADIDICDCVRNVDCGKIHKAIQNIRLCNQMKADIMGLCSIRFAYRYSNPFRWGW